MANTVEIGVIMGTSDYPIMKEAVNILKELEIFAR